MYEIVIIMTGCVLMIPAILRMYPRIMSCFDAWASAEKFDEVDESIMLEGITKAGNHPVGIIVDTALHSFLVILLSMAWPVTIPTCIVALIGYRRRKAAIIIKALQGVEVD